MARGPAYPYVNLESAVNFTRALYDYAKRSPANLNAVLKDKWDFSPTSSSAVKTVAALRYYGLVDLTQSDKGESIKITDRAYRILVDNEDSPERKKAIKDAFLAPRAYKMCWENWGVEMPASMRSTLIFEHGFNESTVDSFLTNYKKSVKYAGLLTGEADSEREDEGDESAEVASAPVQSGAPAPSPQPTPAPRQEASSQGRGTPAVLAKGVGMRQEVFALAEGDVTIQWPEKMSAESWEDFADWLRILERKIKRTVSAGPASGTSGKEDVSDLI